MFLVTEPSWIPPALVNVRIVGSNGWTGLTAVNDFGFVILHPGRHVSESFQWRPGLLLRQWSSPARHTYRTSQFLWQRRVLAAAPTSSHRLCPWRIVNSLSIHLRFISSPLRVAYLSFKNQRGGKPPCQEFFTYDARMRSHFIVNIEKIATRQLAIPIRVDAKTQSFHETIGKHPGFRSRQTEIFE